MEKVKHQVNSVDLYEKIPIETWLRIADCVQHFNISDGNDKEFEENLRMLQKYLLGTEVSLKENDRYAKHFFHVGLATLLQSIYNIQSKSKKEHFIEQIYALEKLGIRTIQFEGDTLQNISCVQGILTSHDYSNKNISYLHKIFTDGSFCIENEGGYAHIFRMTNLHDINYFLNITLILKKERELITKFLEKANATLLNFDGIFPSVEEIMAKHYPSIEMDSSISEWKVTNGIRVTQYFEPYVKKKK